MGYDVVTQTFPISSSSSIITTETRSNRSNEILFGTTYMETLPET